MPYKIFTVITMLLLPHILWGAKDDIRIEAKADVKKSGYVGETYEYTVTLTSNYPNIADIRVASGPDYDENLEVLRGVIQNQRGKEVTEKGKTTFQWVIQRNFIIPKKPGKYTIGDWKFVAFIPVEKVVKDWFWGTRRVVDYEEYPVECKPVTIKADALPANKTGYDYSGCIGDFTIESWFPAGKITAGNEAIAVFTISGYGSLEGLRVPNIVKLFNKGCRLKSVDQNDSQTQRNGQLFSEVTLTCTFMPENEDFTIDPLELLFFNPDSKKYELEESEPLHWTGKENEPTKSSSGKNDAIQI